jgi:hypothetical protein
VLTNAPVVRSIGPRVLFLAAALLTVALLQSMHLMRLAGEMHGLTTIFFVLFAFNDYAAAVCSLLILLGAVFLSGCVPTRRILQWAGNNPKVIALISTLVMAIGALVIYHNHPLSMDEYAAYFQSQIFAAGHLSGSLPPELLDWLIPPGFQDYFLTVSAATGHVTETYWPGFALLLAPFTWAGVPWLCNPVISGATLLVIHRLALEIFQDREAAGLALLLTIASPVIFANGISYYSMPAHLLANCLFALLLIRPTAVRCLAAGVVGSVALALHNPVPHMLFALPWLIWIATRQGGLRLLAATGAGYLPLCALLGVGWFIFTSHLQHDGLMSVASPAMASGRLQAMLSIFTLPSAAVLLARVIGLAKVWVWAVPGLLILASVGAARWRHNTICQLLTASAVLTLLGYCLVPADQGHGWGYRYFHSAWMALPLLATAAMFRPAAATREARTAVEPPPHMFEDLDSRSFATACIVLMLVFGIGFRAWQMQAFMAQDLNQLPNYPGTERRIVLIDDRFSFYGADLVQNDPWLRNNEIRMYSHGAAADRQMMAQHYPTWHKVYADKFGWVWSAPK